MGNTNNINRTKQDSSPLGRYLKAIVSPPPPPPPPWDGYGNPAAWPPRPPPANHDISTSDSSQASEASQRRANNSTGSVKVDDININLDKESMSEDEVNGLLEPEEVDDNEMVVVGDEDS
jgi:hypothetical protein